MYFSWLAKQNEVKTVYKHWFCNMTVKLSPEFLWTLDLLLQLFHYNIRWVLRDYFQHSHFWFQLIIWLAHLEDTLYIDLSFNTSTFNTRYKLLLFEFAIDYVSIILIMLKDFHDTYISCFFSFENKIRIFQFLISFFFNTFKLTRCL